MAKKTAPTRKKKVTKKTQARAVARKKTKKKTTRKKAATKKTRRRVAVRKTKKKRTRRVTRKKATRRGRPRGSGSSTESLVRQLQRRQMALQEKRGQLAAEIEAVDAELALFNSGVGVAGTAKTRVRRKTRGRRGRAPGGGSLVDSLRKVMGKRTMRIADMVTAVKKAGYRSSSSNFRNVVAHTLSKSKVFKRVGRGQYGVK